MGATPSTFGALAVMFFASFLYGFFQAMGKDAWLAPFLTVHGGQ